MHVQSPHIPSSLMLLLASTLFSLPTQTLYLRRLPHAPNTKAPRAAALDWEDAAPLKRVAHPAPAHHSLPNASPPLSYPADMTKRLPNPSEGYLANRELEPLTTSPLQSPESIEQPLSNEETSNPSDKASSSNTFAPHPHPHLNTKRDSDPNPDLDSSPPSNPDPQTIPPSDLSPEAPPQEAHLQLRYESEAAHIAALRARALAEAEARAAARATQEWKKERVRREEARADTVAARAEVAESAVERESRALGQVMEREKRWEEKGEGNPLVGGREAWRRDLMERLDILAGIAVEGM